MTAAAASSFWPQGGGIPEWWPQDAQEAKEVKDLIEQQVRASAQLTGQVGRLEGQMEAVQERLSHHDAATQRLQATMDSVVATVSRIEEQRKSTLSLAKTLWAAILAVGGFIGWLASHYGVNIGTGKQ